jgi:hypothetical protein
MEVHGQNIIFFSMKKIIWISRIFTMKALNGEMYLYAAWDHDFWKVHMKPENWKNFSRIELFFDFSGFSHRTRYIFELEQ